MRSEGAGASRLVPRRASEPRAHVDWARVLEGVSRTFAITIPALPDGLRDVVTNAYLLCRIADTVEDDPGIPIERKRRLHGEIFEALDGTRDADALGREIARELGDRPLPAERDLVCALPSVVEKARGFSETQLAAVSRCVRIMCDGMSRFPTGIGRRGLPDVATLHSYCYYVAGVVGEMLTALFCDHSEAVASRRAPLAALAVSFGQGLQMTNILKDVRDDFERGFCWLPRDVFDRAGFDLDDLSSGRDAPGDGFRRGMGELIALAHAHLRDALAYTLLVPREEPGIRRFCLRALFFAVLTLRKIDRRRAFAKASEIKISRRSVRLAIAASDLFTRSDAAIRALFAMGSVGLPRAEAFERENGWTRERLRCEFPS
jgi:farnesyl-diphosphate farnesyltransferase